MELEIGETMMSCRGLKTYMWAIRISDIDHIVSRNYTRGEVEDYRIQIWRKLGTRDATVTFQFTGLSLERHNEFFKEIVSAIERHDGSDYGEA